MTFPPPPRRSRVHGRRAVPFGPPRTKRNSWAPLAPILRPSPARSPTRSPSCTRAGSSSRAPRPRSSAIPKRRRPASSSPACSKPAAPSCLGAGKGRGHLGGGPGRLWPPPRWPRLGRDAEGPGERRRGKGAGRGQGAPSCSFWSSQDHKEQPEDRGREGLRGDAGNVTSTYGRREGCDPSTAAPATSADLGSPWRPQVSTRREGVVEVWRDPGVRAVPVTSPRRDVPSLRQLPAQDHPSRAFRRRPQPARVASETPGPMVPA